MMRVSEIMTRSVSTLSPDATIREAMELLCLNHLGGAPVVRGNVVVGVISMTDIADILVNASEPLTIDGDSILDQRNVSDAMSRDVISVSPGTPVRRAASLMRERGVHRVLVMEDDHLAGIVSALDIARTVSEKDIAGRTAVTLDPRCDEPSSWITV